MKKEYLTNIKKKQNQLQFIQTFNIFNNNIILDKEKKIKIPQNKTTFYKIEKSLFMNYSIEIIINPYESVNIPNLFLTIKSFSCNIRYIPHLVLIIVKNTNNEFIAHNLHIDHFKKISYNSFLNWFNKQLHNDWAYIEKDGLYSFIFTYPVEIFDRELLNYLKPKYPWSSEITEFVSKSIEDYEDQRMIILEQQNEIKILKNRIIELEKNIKK